MIDKNHKYFYVIQGEVEYNDNISQSLNPINLITVYIVLMKIEKCFTMK